MTAARGPRSWLLGAGLTFLLVVVLTKTVDFATSGCVTTGRSGEPTCGSGALVFIAVIWTILAVTAVATFWSLRRRGRPRD